MNLQKGPFLSIKEGRKTVEMRLFDEKRSRIKTGDEIEFDCGNEKLSVKVIALKRFPDFKSLYEAYPLKSLGYEEKEFKTASYKDMEIYYPKEKQDKYGVLAIEIKLK